MAPENPDFCPKTATTQAVFGLKNTPLLEIREVFGCQTAPSALDTSVSNNVRQATQSLGQANATLGGSLHADSSCRQRLLLQKCKRLELCDFKRLTTAYIGARQFVVPPHHVGLRLGEPRSVPLVRPARDLRPLPPYNPCHLVLRRLTALGAYKRMRAKLRRFVEKIPLFHGS